MQIGQESSHMRTMNQALLDLVAIRKINDKTAMGIAQDPVEMAELLNKFYARGGTPGKPNRR